MMKVAVLGIGALGPGLADWSQGRALLHEPAAWRHEPTRVPVPNRLPATERRRAGTVVKAAIAVADEAVAAAGADASVLATVFTSSTGDPLNCHQMLEALATPARLVSPTRFTNSVHNAAAGYWHITAQSRQPSTSLAAYDASFGAGLLEAAAQCLSSGAPVLLVACDVPFPEPLHALRPVSDVFALALLLAPPAAAGPHLTLDVLGDEPSTACADAGLEAVRRTIPAARALPLLQALAGGGAQVCVVEGPPGMALRLQVEAAA